MAGKKRKDFNTVSIVDEAKLYLSEFGKATTLRTTPQPNLPSTAEMLLRATDLATKGKDTEVVKYGAITTQLAKVIKLSDSAYSVLATMSDNPFPLISAGKSISENSDKLQYNTLVNKINGKPVGSRYARIALSELGKYATRHHRGTKMGDRDFHFHKSFVPISLLTSSSPWTLGYKSTMLPLNPSELFNLMEKMIVANSKELPDEDIQKYFKGPDLGEDYIIKTKTESLLYLYGTGRGMFMVMPKIRIDYKYRAIIIQAPPYGSYTNILKKHFYDYLNHLDEYRQTNSNKILKTFRFTDISVNGKEFYFNNVEFLTNDENEIRNELWSLPQIRKVLYATNTCVDQELNKIDIKPIKDVLWQHILYEEEMVRKEYEIKLDQAKRELFYAHLLEKVTRDGVNQVIKELLLDPHRVSRLAEIFGEHSTSEQKQKYMSDTYLSTEEVNLIWQEKNNIVVDGEKINILAILLYREKYKNKWITIEERVKEIEDILSSPERIREIIRKDLVHLTSTNRYARKSEISFLEKDDDFYSYSIFDDPLEMKPLPYNKVYDTYKLPVTLFYSNKIIYKNYGKNYNVPNKLKDESLFRALNCMNTDKVIILTNKGSELVQVNKLPSTWICKYDIRGIVPYDEEYKQAILYHRLGYVNGIKDVIESKIYVIEPKTSALPCGEDVYASATVTLDMSKNDCIDLLLHNHYRGEHILPKGYKKIHKANLLNTIGWQDLPSGWGAIVDICDSKSNDGQFLFKYKSYDYRDFDNPPTEVIERAIEIEKDIFSIFSKNLEFYYKNYYIHNILYYNIVGTQKYNKPKKFVLTEHTFKHKSNVASNNLDQDLIMAYYQDEDRERNMLFVQSYNTRAYDNFQITDIEFNQWSIIDKAFELPNSKPTKDKRKIKICNDFMNQVFEGTTVLKQTTPIRKIKELDEVQVKIDYANEDVYVDDEDENPTDN